MDQEDIRELYQSLVLSHSKKPHNFGILEPCSCHQSGKNVSCGDELELYLLFNKDKTNIEKIQFTGEGCALFMSSSSMMTDLIKGKNIEESNIIVQQFFNFLLNDNQILDDKFEPLHIFESVKNIPSRIKCVALPWRTFEYLIKNKIDKDNN